MSLLRGITSLSNSGNVRLRYNILKRGCSYRGVSNLVFFTTGSISRVSVLPPPAAPPYNASNTASGKLRNSDCRDVGFHVLIDIACVSHDALGMFNFV